MKLFTAFHLNCPTLLHFGSHAEPAAGRFSQARIPQPFPNRRSLLRDLHTFGIVSVFRRPENL
jgi:hypothetical protein